MTAMKLLRDPLIHPIAVVIRFPVEIAVRPKVLAWRGRSRARRHGALGDIRHRGIEASLDKYERAFESA